MAVFFQILFLPAGFNISDINSLFVKKDKNVDKYLSGKLIKFE